jgi:hypothetical protein
MGEDGEDEQYGDNEDNIVAQPAPKPKRAPRAESSVSMSPMPKSRSAEPPPQEVVEEYVHLLQVLYDSEQQLEQIKASGKQSGLFSAMQEVVKIKNQVEAMAKKYPELRKIR